MTTMRDVAAVAGVSAKTVSRVFNDDRHVRPETRARVEAALKQLNYLPNMLATSFRTGRSPVVGIAVPNIVDPFFAAIAGSIGRLVGRHNMSIVLTELGNDSDREESIVVGLLRQSLSGLVIAPISTDHSYLAPWAARTPIVFVDRGPIRLTADSFTEDDHGGASSATNHLINHGHHRIAFMGDTLDRPTTRNRLNGYKDTLEAAHLELRNNYVVLGVWDRQSAADAVRRLQELEEPPTAVFTSNARCTMALVPSLLASNLAVVGFGDFPLADMLKPTITVIDQDPEGLGALAGQRVLDRLARPRRHYRRQTVLPVSLVERESCRRDRRDK